MNRCEVLELQSENLWELCFTMITSNGVEENTKLLHINFLCNFFCLHMNEQKFGYAYLFFYIFFHVHMVVRVKLGLVLLPL